MTVIAYASGSVNVGQNPPIEYTEEHDPVLDLAAAGFAFPEDVQLYGNGTDSADAAPVWTWQWNILAQNDQNPIASLSGNGLIQDPVLEGVNTWGNVRLFLIVKNATTDETSETDPLKAPDSAFVTVRMRSPNASIQKCAAGERNWDNDTNEWAQAIEDIAAGGGAVHDHNIIDHLDVVDATGADLEALTGGGYADDPDGVAPNANGILHKHHGPDVDEGTTNTRGTVAIESVHSAVAINIETVMFTGHADGTYTWVGWTPHICTPNIVGEQPLPHNRNHIDFATHSSGTLYLKEVYITLAQGGLANPAAAGMDEYEFEVVSGTAADWVANNQNVHFTMSGKPAVDFQGFAIQKVGQNIELVKGKILSVRCTASPHKGGDFGNLGHGLNVTMKLWRRAGDGI